MLYRLISGRSRAVLNRKAQPGGTALTAADIIEPVRTCHASGIAPDGATADCAAIDAALAPQRKRFYSGLLATPPDAFADRAQAFAFWINLYNLPIRDAVTTFRVRRATVGLARGIMRFFEKAAYNVGSHRFSANDIENGVRANAPHAAARGLHFGDGDPRGAAVLEPVDPVSTSPSTVPADPAPAPGSTNRTGWTNNWTRRPAPSWPETCRWTAWAREVTLSKIFAWFAPDFEDAGGALAAAIQHMPEDDGVRLWLEPHQENVTVKFRPCDWRLNTVP